MHRNGGQFDGPAAGGRLERLEPRLLLDGSLLVVAGEPYADHLAAYADHKASLGWDVTVASTATTGTTAAGIRDWIREFRDTEGLPDALLLVGDSDTVPSFPGGGGGPPTDLYYGCLDGATPAEMYADWSDPDVPVGRWSVRTLGDLDTVVAKTIEYETAPSADWMSRALFLAGDGLRDGEALHDEMISAYLDGYEVERLYSWTNGSDTRDVVEALRGGASLAVFYGHGKPQGWDDGPTFYQAHVSLTEGAAGLPFVASFTCNSGLYDREDVYAEVFAETMLRQQGGGAVAVWAASGLSYPDSMQPLQRALFAAIHEDGHRAFGDIVLGAKDRYLAEAGATDTVRDHWEMYNLIGDPTVELAGVDGLRITNPSRLPPAMAGEAYELVLTARNTAGPIAWGLDGALPGGIDFDPAAGVLSGTPAEPGEAEFVLRASDGSGTDERVFTLAITTPLAVGGAEPLVAWQGRPVDVPIPAAGGEGPYEWSVTDAEYFETYLPEGGWIGGGTDMGWRGDDAVWRLDLPWEFDFYGEPHRTLYVGSNGFIDLLDYVDAGKEASAAALENNRRIAPLWDDLVMDRPGEGVYVSADSERVVIRWDAHRQYGMDADFEAVLHRDGRIAFHYAADTWMWGAVGISRGDGGRFVHSQRLLDGNPVEAGSSLFSPRHLPAAGLTLTPDGRVVGTAEARGEYSFELDVAEAGPAGQTARATVALEVRRAGDFDGDGAVTAADIDALHAAIRAERYERDLTGDGLLDSADAEELIGALVFLDGDPSRRGTVRGDANLDGRVDAADVSMLVPGWLSGVSGWAEGDFTGDGIADSADLSLLAANWGWRKPADDPPPAPAAETLIRADAESSAAIPPAERPVHLAGEPAVAPTPASPPPTHDSAPTAVPPTESPVRKHGEAVADNPVPAKSAEALGRRRVYGGAAGDGYGLALRAGPWHPASLEIIDVLALSVETLRPHF